ncbi:hypothetical protein PS15p_208514 [Mucor circinelloides]
MSSISAITCSKVDTIKEFNPVNLSQRHDNTPAAIEAPKSRPGTCNKGSTNSSISNSNQIEEQQQQYKQKSSQKHRHKQQRNRQQRQQHQKSPTRQRFHGR